ncbi:hypothetical protein EDC56_0044 [Sinobacterium caligoides]|uniref:Transcriptional regulator SutA RNAP-binding domain-containing protein n=1 Tax=Sinobacterium caligoides TaxID=933926 RepID=A0A3N2E2D2_9GAMM|nr:hypothetical protein [Sinobacterium caligoides]ROS06137.1 hypothetical protein EDC56_0044 [Sinobacterium caligoides]
MTSVPRSNTLPSRDALRHQIANEVAAFLSSGGKIDKVTRPNEPTSHTPKPRPWMGDIL